jgi:acid stress-induced BolA-like protein IbaG/YrbA
MITSQQLQGWIQDGLACDHIQVRGDDGQHFDQRVSAAVHGVVMVQALRQTAKLSTKFTKCHEDVSRRFVPFVFFVDDSLLLIDSVFPG